MLILEKRLAGASGAATTNYWGVPSHVKQYQVLDCITTVTQGTVGASAVTLTLSRSSTAIGTVTIAAGATAGTHDTYTPDSSSANLIITPGTTKLKAVMSDPKATVIVEAVLTIAPLNTAPEP